jgi:hypothetical protein
MNRQDEFIVVMKDMLLLFAVLASVGSFYHAKVVAGFAYMAVAAALHYEAGLRLWLRRHFSSDV